MKVELMKSDSYIETMTIKPVDAMHGMLEVKVESQLLHAKEPDKMQVRYQSIMSLQDLHRLNKQLDAYLLDLYLQDYPDFSCNP